MPQQAIHDAMPHISHDEMARQNFALRIREYVAGDIVNGNSDIYHKLAEPVFVKSFGRKPSTRKEVRKIIQTQPFHQTWSSLNRTTQEIIWDSVQTTLDRQDEELNKRIKNINSPKGSLKLNSSLKIPRYLSAVDIHCMPGNYYSENDIDDAYQGALLDRGAYIYSRGSRGPYHDSFGQDVGKYIKKTKPKRILDMGCASGQATCAIAEIFPNAELHAIDVAAPLLRYGYKRSSSLGYAINFSQMNAESTSFDDKSFDLIFSCIMMHETSSKAFRNYLRETYRLLKPGGLGLHMDFPHNENKSPYNQAMVDWNTHYNAEPFIGKLGDIDKVKVAIESGFSNREASCVPMSSIFQGNEMHMLDLRKTLK